MTNLSAVTSDYRRIGRTTLDVWTHYLSEPSANGGASPLLPHATAMWTEAGEHSALCLAQMKLENDFARTGIIIQPEDGNPLSLRPWIEDPRAVRTGDVIDWKTRKRVRTLKVPPYAVGAVIASDGGMFLRFDDPAMCVREWRRRIADDPGYKHGVYLPAKSLRDFLNIYAPPGDTHPVTGLPNENTKYYEVVTTMLERFAAMEADDTSPDPQPGDNEGNDMATHKFIISMGHRNTDRGGAYREYDWTPGAARALRDAIKARGGQAWIIQEERGTGDFYNGGLQAAARACVDLARTKGPFDAYISMHYDSSPGFHAIYPNGANDTKAMNPLDVRLCEAMSRRVAATKTVRMKTWPSHGVGVMDEKETYVGSQGYRLGEFVGTLGFRDTTARVITEASGVGDDKYLHDPKWVRNVYSEALVDALEDVFGKFKGTKPEPQPEPEPEPQPEYEKADPIEEVAALPFYVKLDNGAQMVRVDLSVRATTATPRRKWAHAQSPKIGPDIRKGEEFKVDYLIINADGSLYWYTPWATRVALADTEPIFADVDPQQVINALKDVLDDSAQ